MQKLIYKPSNFTQDMIFNLDNKDEYEYTFIANIEISKELQKKIKDYPTLPVHYIHEEELSEY